MLTMDNNQTINNLETKVMLQITFKAEVFYTTPICFFDTIYMIR